MLRGRIICQFSFTHVTCIVFNFIFIVFLSFSERVITKSKVIPGSSIENDLVVFKSPGIDASRSTGDFPLGAPSGCHERQSSSPAAPLPTILCR